MQHISTTYALNEPGATSLAGARPLVFAGNRRVTAQFYDGDCVSIFVGTDLYFDDMLPDHLEPGSPEFFAWVIEVATRQEQARTEEEASASEHLRELFRRYCAETAAAVGDPAALPPIDDLTIDAFLAVCAAELDGVSAAEVWFALADDPTEQEVRRMSDRVCWAIAQTRGLTVDWTLHASLGETNQTALWHALVCDPYRRPAGLPRRTPGAATAELAELEAAGWTR